MQLLERAVRPGEPADTFLRNPNEGDTETGIIVHINPGSIERRIDLTLLANGKTFIKRSEGMIRLLVYALIWGILARCLDVGSGVVPSIAWLLWFTCFFVASDWAWRVQNRLKDAGGWPRCPSINPGGPGPSLLGTWDSCTTEEPTPMTTAAICASREVPWSQSFYRGEQYDADLGLYYLRARYYNPGTGRFLSRDPEEGKARKTKTLHKYLYAGGDPVNAVDPTGRDLLEWAIMTYHMMYEGVRFGHKLGPCISDAVEREAKLFSAALNGVSTTDSGQKIADDLGQCAGEAAKHLLGASMGFFI